MYFFELFPSTFGYIGSIVLFVMFCRWYYVHIMEVDIPYSLRLLKKLNALTLEGKQIGEYFPEGEYSLWSIQQYFLLAQIKQYSEYKDFETYARTKSLVKISIFSIMKRMLMNAFILVISFLAVCKMHFAKTTVLIFSSDILKPGTRYNPRLFATFTELENRNVSYMEFIHTVGGAKILFNFFRLRRLVFYSESINILIAFLRALRIQKRFKVPFDSLDLSGFSDSERRFVLDLLNESVHNMEVSRDKIRLLGRMVQHTSLRSFIAIDDVRHVHEIIAACRGASIESCVYQHSNFDYLTGLDELPPAQYIFPDTFFVWNEYWKNRIPELSPLYAHYKDRLVVGGRAYLFTPGECGERKTSHDSILNVAVPYEVNVNRADIRPYIQAMLASPHLRVFLLLRGDFERELQLTKYLALEHREHPRLTIIEPGEKEKVLDHIDVVAGVYSGFLDEAIERCIPVGVFQTSYPLFNDLVAGNIADAVNLKGDDLSVQFKQIAHTPQSTLTERRSVFMKGAGSAKQSLDYILKRQKTSC